MHGRIPPVLHGDLKPSNICLANPLGEGELVVKVVD